MAISAAQAGALAGKFAPRRCVRIRTQQTPNCMACTVCGGDTKPADNGLCTACRGLAATFASATSGSAS